RVELRDSPAPTATLTARAVFADGSVALAHPRLQIADDMAIGLELLDADGVAFEWLRAHLGAGLDFDMGNSACLIALDVREGNGVARHRPATSGGPALVWRDKF